ncbi:MAG: nuclear transport factor 2 family protein [Jejuia sp.]
MKFNTSLLFFITLLIFSCNNTKPIEIDNSRDFKEVEHVVQGVFDDIWSDKKAELLTKYHTDDFILLEHGEIWTNDTIANWCKRAKVRDNGIMRTNSFDFFEAKREGDKIWMAYHNYATFKKDTLLGKAQWLESIVAVKQDNIWKLELMHSTRVPRNN